MYAAHFNRLSDLPVQVQIMLGVEDARLDADIEIQLRRIVQKPLTNVRKHARAQRKRDRPQRRPATRVG